MNEQNHMDNYEEEEEEEEEDVNALPENIMQTIKNNKIGNLLDLDLNDEAAPVNSLGFNNASGDLLSINATTSNGDIIKLLSSPPSFTFNSFNPGSPHQSSNNVMNQTILNDPFANIF